MFFKNGSAASIKFLLVSSTDHISPVLGATPTGVIAKEGGTFNAVAGTFAGVGNGWYKYTATSGETNTNGSLLLHVTASGADPADVQVQVVAFDPNDSIRLGLSALPNVAAGAAGGLPLGDSSGNVTLSSAYQTTLVSAVAGAILANTANKLATDASGFVTIISSQATSIATASGTAAATAILATPSQKLVTDSSGRVTVGTNADKTGYSLTQAFPTNFAALAITSGGAVTAGTVSDKTGYALTQAFPSNFSLLSISGGGAVTAGTVSDKTGYSLTQTFPANFAALSITSGTGLVTATNGGSGGLTLDTTLSGHTTSGTVGGALAELDAAISTRAAASVIPANFNLMAIDASGLVGLTPAQHTAIAADVTAALTAQGYTSVRAALLDRLDAAISSRVATGALPANFSALSIDSSGNVSLPAAMQAAISGSVWDALTASHIANGSFGKLVEGFAGNPTPPTLSQIVAGVWNELTSGHTTAGSFATLLGTIATLAQTSVNFGAPPAASAIATACAAAILSIPGNKLITDSAGAVAVNNFAAGLLDLADGIEAGVTVREGFRAFLSALAGIVTGGGTDSLSFFAGGNPGTLRISATVDDQGNRTAITLHL